MSIEDVQVGPHALALHGHLQAISTDWCSPAKVCRPDHPWSQVRTLANDVFLDPLHPAIGIGAGGSIIFVFSFLRNADVEDPGVPGDVRRPIHTIVIPLLLLLLLLLLLEMLRLVVLPPDLTLVDEWLRLVLGWR